MYEPQYHLTLQKYINTPQNVTPRFPNVDMAELDAMCLGKPIVRPTRAMASSILLNHFCSGVSLSASPGSRCCGPSCCGPGRRSPGRRDQGRARDAGEAPV